MDYAPAPLPDELRDRYRRSGFQTDVSFPALMRRNRTEFGTRTAVIEDETELSWKELVGTAARFSGFLHANGVGAGDVVVWQLPNWWESLVVAYGIWALGAVSSPVVPIYREFELANVVGAVHPRCVVAPRSFHGRDHVEMMNAACERAGESPPVRVVLRGTSTGWTSFDDTLSASPFIAEQVDVDAPALVGWTSGTTSGSKGVVHSARSFLSLSVRSNRWQGNSWEDRSYMPAPIAHATGLLSAITIPIYTGASTVLRDGWDAGRAIDDILHHEVTTSSGAAVFMREILDALGARGSSQLRLRSGYPCGGSTIPTELAQACDDAGMLPARSWGMTECPSVTASGPRLHPRRIRTATDGVIAPGCEIRVVDELENDLPLDQLGELLVRGPQRALGYLEAAHTAEGFDDQGWFRTGDMGCLDDEGAFTMNGRKKDIINRGGEKLSSREIEDAIAQHPGVSEVAVLPVPHPRLGEQPAAVVLTIGEAVGPDELAAFLRDLGLAPQKIPGVWRFVDELPRTASGKVKKNLLAENFEQEPASS